MNAIARKAIAAIDWYRRVISPRKGFSCAYRAAWGGRSCSGVVRFAFAHDGAGGGMRAMCAQPFKCRAAMRALKKRHGTRAEWPKIEGVALCCWIPFLGI